MKVKFYKIEKKRIGNQDIVVIYTKGTYKGTMEIKNGELSYYGKKDEGLLDILFRPYHMILPDVRKNRVRERLLYPGTPQHLEAIRRSCWNYGYIAEIEED